MQMLFFHFQLVLLPFLFPPSLPHIRLPQINRHLIRIDEPFEKLYAGWSKNLFSYCWKLEREFVDVLSLQFAVHGKLENQLSSEWGCHDGK